MSIQPFITDHMGGEDPGCWESDDYNDPVGNLVRYRNLIATLLSKCKGPLFPLKLRLGSTSRQHRELVWLR